MSEQVTAFTQYYKALLHVSAYGTADYSLCDPDEQQEFCEFVRAGAVGPLVVETAETCVRAGVPMRDSWLQAVVTGFEIDRTRGPISAQSRAGLCSLLRDMFPTRIRLGVGQQTPTDSPRPKVGVKKISLAIAVLHEHPEWSNKQIAEAAGLQPETLSRNPKFATVRDAIADAGKLDMRRAKFNRGSDMDAYE